MSCNLQLFYSEDNVQGVVRSRDRLTCYSLGYLHYELTALSSNNT